MRHMDGRSRDIYGARGWGKTHSNVFISIIAPRPFTASRYWGRFIAPEMERPTQEGSINRHSVTNHEEV